MVFRITTQKKRDETTTRVTSFLLPDEAATLLGITKGTLYRWEKKAGIEPIRSGPPIGAEGTKKPKRLYTLETIALLAEERLDSYIPLQGEKHGKSVEII